MSLVEKLNKKLGPYYALFISVGFFGALLVSVYKFIFLPTDLKVTIQTDEMTYPKSLGKTYENIFAKIPYKDSLTVLNGVTIYNFIFNTNEQKTITIENISDKTLRDISFKHLNTDAVTAYSINSDFFNKEEEKKLYDNLISDDKRGMTHLKQLINLPPKKTIKIKLWGNFKKTLLDDDVIISHSEGDAFFDKNYVISGFKGYFVQYLFEFLVILILIFFGIYHYGVKYTINKRFQESN